MLDSRLHYTEYDRTRQLCVERVSRQVGGKAAGGLHLAESERSKMPLYPYYYQQAFRCVSIILSAYGMFDLRMA